METWRDYNLAVSLMCIRGRMRSFVVILESLSTFEEIIHKQ